MITALAALIWYVGIWVAWGYLMLPISILIDNLAVFIGGKNRLFVEVFSFLGILLAAIILSQGLIYVTLVSFSYLCRVSLKH